MKISIVGAGNAGCFTALHYGYYLRKNKEVEIELIYDPNTPTEFVGQGTQLEATDLMGKALDICQYFISNGINVYLAELKDKDPSDLGYKHITNILFESKPITGSDLMLKKMGMVF